MIPQDPVGRKTGQLNDESSLELLGSTSGLLGAVGFN